MNINPIIINALEPLDIPVAHLRYTGEERTYITFYSYAERPELFADDEPQYEVTYATVDLFTERDYTTLIEEIKTKLKDAGCTASRGPESIDDDTGLYHVIIEVTKEGSAKWQESE